MANNYLIFSTMYKPPEGHGDLTQDLNLEDAIVNECEDDEEEFYSPEFEIESENEDFTIQMVEGGKGNEVMFEYSHTLSRDTWSVEEINE